MKRHDKQFRLTTSMNHSPEPCVFFIQLVICLEHVCCVNIVRALRIRLDKEGPYPFSIFYERCTAVPRVRKKIKVTNTKKKGLND